MSSVLDPAELSASPLADLHVLAGEIGVEGFRRLRKAELIDAILVASGQEPAPKVEAPEPDADASDGDEDEDRPRRRSRGGRSRSRRASEETEEATAAGDEADASEPPDEERAPRRRSRGGRGRSAERNGDDSPSSSSSSNEEETQTEGTVEVMPNGSGFVRVSGSEASDGDVYVSAAQIKRCELVSGDKVTGPVRPPRRSERHPSLIRVDTINDRPADEVAEGTRFDDLPTAFPDARFELGSDDPTVKAVEWLTPFGRGSRVTVVGPPQSGKTETLQRLATALQALEGVEVSLVLAGSRPEEGAEWAKTGLTPGGAATLGTSPEAQAQVIEQAVEQAKRQASRGSDAVLIVDSVEQLQLLAARRALGAARNIVDGGSLTVIAGAPIAVGGETTIIALDPVLTALRRFPALDLAASGTLKPELLVGDAGAEAIAKARGEVLR